MTGVQVIYLEGDLKKQEGEANQEKRPIKGRSIKIATAHNRASALPHLSKACRMPPKVFHQKDKRVAYAAPASHDH